MATKAEVVALAHRMIGVVATDEPLTADQTAFATPILDAEFAEFTTTQTGVSWTLDDVPSEAFVPLATLLASVIASHYGVAGPARTSAIARLRAAEISDDRDGAYTSGDYDEAARFF